jgi:hypothetical protein
MHLHGWANPGGCFARKVHYVDAKPAIALGGEYFLKLKRGQAGDAFAMYTDEFWHEQGENWQKLLFELNMRTEPLPDSLSSTPE